MWSTDLTLSRLNDMMRIFMGKPFAKHVPPRTYIFVPTVCPDFPDFRTYGNVHVSGNGNHAEDWMVKHCGLPSTFYLTSALCNDAQNIHRKYKRKPIIYIA